MTPGDNGASTPEDEDPFGYLYADGQARGAQPPSGGYGYPNSVNRVRAVGERQYGQSQAPYGQPQAQYGQPQATVPQQQGGYGQPNAHYQAPETLPGGAPAGRRPAPTGGGRGGPNTKGLLIGAIAVVAAVVIGISVAMINGNSDDSAGNDPTSPPAQSQTGEPTPSKTGSAPAGELPKSDAQALQLAGGAAKTTGVEGAKSDGGVYVGGLSTVGASATWTATVPEDGPYTLFVNYSAPSADPQSMTVTVNGKEFGSKLSLQNYAKAPEGDFAKGWTTTYVWPTLNKGDNTISISCQAGDKCNVLLDQLWLKKGQVKRDS
ncbi:carbohydrate-binding protein [Streptomyces sp. NPDC048297]|uniref:carbohydrate-binding protein n=1 Tax=Streptomyces sp. NPDC048297 TaxID=3365531 RepID=UPI00371A89C9